MTIDERLHAVAQQLDTLPKIHLDNDREFRERFQLLTQAQVRLEQAQARLTESQEKLTQSQERNARDIEALTGSLQVLQGFVRQDGENIRALARIAELHHQRLDHLEQQ